MLRKSFEPAADADDVGYCVVSDGEFVVAGGEGAVLLQAVDTAFDCVAIARDQGSNRCGRPPWERLAARFLTWSALIGMVALMPFFVSQDRFSRDE